MSNRTRLVAIPLALAAGLAIAAPAQAQVYSPRELRSEINQLEDQIQRIGESRRYTNSEYRSLNNRIEGLRDTYHRYGRDGFSRRELAGLSERVDDVRRIIRQEARDDDRLRR